MIILIRGTVNAPASATLKLSFCFCFKASTLHYMTKLAPTWAGDLRGKDGGDRSDSCQFEHIMLNFRAANSQLRMKQTSDISGVKTSMHDSQISQLENPWNNFPCRAPAVTVVQFSRWCITRQIPKAFDLASTFHRSGMIIKIRRLMKRRLTQHGNGPLISLMTWSAERPAGWIQIACTYSAQLSADFMFVPMQVGPTTPVHWQRGWTLRSDPSTPGCGLKNTFMSRLIRQLVSYCFAWKRRFNSSLMCINYIHKPPSSGHFS